MSSEEHRCIRPQRLGTKSLDQGYRPGFSAGFWLMVDFTWRNITLFVVALVITSCLMAWAVIIAVDRLLYADWDPIKIERPAI